MPNPSPLCVASDAGGSFVATYPTGVNVGAGDAIRVRLADPSGVKTWELTVWGLDDVSVAPVLTYSGGPPSEYSFAFPNAAGRAIGFQSVVNGGVDINGVPQSSYTTTFALFTLISGKRVLFTNERLESSPSGWLADVNAFIRAGAGAGFTAGTDLASIDSTNQKVVGFNGQPLDTTGTVGQSKLWLWDAGSINKYSLRLLTDDDKGAAYLPVLSFSSGGASPVEIGATVTPFFNHNPVLTTLGLTAAAISDSQGNGPTSRLGSSNGFQATLASYTASATPGTTLLFSLQSTKNGVTKTATAGVTPAARVFLGFGASTSATGITQSGGNATVTGPAAALTGFLSTSVSGNQSLFGTQTPSSNWLWVAWDSSLGGASLAQTKLTDKASGFLIDMQTATSFTTTTATGLTRTYFVARSTNNLGTTALQPYFAA